MRFNWEVSLGNIVQLLLFAGALLIAYGNFSTKFVDMSKTVDETHRQTVRIERYLSSTDPQYWHKVAENGDRER